MVGDGVLTSIRSGWSKFRNLLPLLNSRDLSLRENWNC